MRLVRSISTGMRMYMEELNRQNFSKQLSGFIEDEDLSCRQVAKAIGCSEATICRLCPERSTWASDEMLNRAKVMLYLGFRQYSKLSESQKRTIEEKAVGLGGGVASIGAIAFAVNSMGLVTGLSAAGITSGLAAIGGTMMGGVMVAAAAPVAVGAVGYGVVRGMKHVLDNQKLSKISIDLRWEIPRQNPRT